MTPDRLRTIIAAYGAAPARWPADERAAAEALLARSAEARALLAEAADIDAALDRALLTPPQLDPVALAAAASARPQPRRRAAARRIDFGALFGWPRFAALAAAAIAGIVIGVSGIGPASSPASGGESDLLFGTEDVVPW
jgi:anti-sigma factor RsiW